MRDPPTSTPPPPVRSNAEWLRDLYSTDAARTHALEDLRGYLVRAAVMYLGRHGRQFTRWERAELVQLAEDLAQDSLMDILKKLDTFRGESRFTTWAYKFVINAAADELRRHHWRDLSLDALPSLDDLPPLLESLPNAKTVDPEKSLLREQVWATLQSIISQELSARQRRVLLALLVYDAPVEQVAQELLTNPNNVYKILHDARKKVKHCLLREGFTPESIADLFGDTV